MTLIEAAKQALEALEAHADIGIKSDKAITALRTAIEQAEKQEPVAYLWQHSETGRTRIVMPDQIITTDATWFVVGPLHLGTPPAPVQEPVAQCMEHGECFGGECIYATPPAQPAPVQEPVWDSSSPLVTTPHTAFARRHAAQRQWVGLERDIAIAVLNHCYGHIVISADMIDRTTEVIKAKLKEKNK